MAQRHVKTSNEFKILVTKITIWNFFRWFLPSHKSSVVLEICLQCSARGCEATQGTSTPGLSVSVCTWGARGCEATQGTSTPGLSVSVCACSVAQSCLTLCDPKDCNLPGSSVHGMFQARMLEWVAVSSSRGSSRSRD